MQATDSEHSNDSVGYSDLHNFFFFSPSYQVRVIVKWEINGCRVTCVREIHLDSHESN